MLSQNLLSKKVLISLLCFSLVLLSSGQESKRRSLIEVLFSLQEEFEVSFSYQDSDIEGITVFPPPFSESIKESINFLSVQTGLSFHQLDEQFIAIIKPSTPRKIACGFIKALDKTSPLVNATIESSGTSTVSDKQGFFSLEDLPEGALISIRYLGYQTQYLAPSAFTSGCQSIVMVPSIASLPEVTIYNYLTRGVDRSTDGTLVIHPQNQQLLPGMTEPDVLFSIQALPGIQSTEETVSNLNIRGGTNDQNLVLWEGIRMFQTGHFFGLISAFNPYFNDQVRITTSGTPARYGHATSGTIQMQSSDDIPEKVSGSAGLGLNMINGDINLEIPISAKTGIKVSARRAITDLVQTPTFDRYFERAFENTDVLNTGTTSTPNSNHSFRFYDFSSRLNHRISKKQSLSLSFLTISNRLEFEELLGGTSQTSTLDQNSVATGVSYNKQWNSKVSSSLSSTLSSYQLMAVNFDLPADQKLIQENEVLNYNFLAITNLKLENHEIEVGLEVDEIGVENLEDINNPNLRRVIKDVVTSYSGFVQGNLKHKKLEVKAGARATYYKRLKQLVVEPRLSLIYQFTPELSLELLGEQKSQVLTQVIDLQTDFLGVEKRRWILSNELDIPVVSSRNVSIGAQYKKKNFLISATGYIRETDGITSSGQGFLNQFQLIRTSGSYQVKGLEFLLTHSFQYFTTWLNTSLIKNTYDFPLFIPRQFASNLDVKNSTSMGVSFDGGPIELSIGINSRSGRPFTLVRDDNPILNGEIQYESPNGARLKSYLRVDFSANYKFKLGTNVGGHLGLSFWNITNQDNVLNQYYQVIDNEVVTLRQRALALTPNLIFRVTF